MDIPTFNWETIEWRTIEGPIFKDIYYYVYDVDEANASVDVLFRFSANSQINLHRHLARYRTFVVQGELRIYRPNGELKEIRPTGSYVLTEPLGEPHREGGGDQDVIVFFSNRNLEDSGGGMYDMLDDDMNSLAILGISDFKALLDAQREEEAARREPA